MLYVATCGNDRKVKFIDQLTLEKYFEISSSTIAYESIFFSPYSELIIASGGNCIEMWNYAKKQRLHIYNGHQNTVKAAQFMKNSGDDSKFVSVS